MSWLFGLALFSFSRSNNVVLFVAGVLCRVACVSCLFSICDSPFGSVAKAGVFICYFQFILLLTTCLFLAVNIFKQLGSPWLIYR